MGNFTSDIAYFNKVLIGKAGRSIDHLHTIGLALFFQHGVLVADYFIETDLQILHRNFLFALTGLATKINRLQKTT